MWSPIHPDSKFATACVVALAMLSAATSAPGAQPPELWPGSQLGLNTAIADSDVIETAEIRSVGIGIHSGPHSYQGVRISPVSDS